MVIVVRASGHGDKGRSPLQVQLIGYIQMVWLCCASFLFGSTVGGSLLRSFCLVLLFSASIAAMRGVCIGLGQWVEDALDVMVFEYDSADECRAIELVLTAMPGALVEVHPAYHKQDLAVIQSTTFVDGYMIAMNTRRRYSNVCTEQRWCPCPAGSNETTFVFNQKVIGRWFVFIRVTIVGYLLLAVLNVGLPGLFISSGIAFIGTFVIMFVWHQHRGIWAVITGIEGQVQPASA